MNSPAALSADLLGIIMPCTSCLKPNRIHFERLGAAARCGRCKAALPPSTQPIDVPTSATFEALISRSAIPVLVDFWAPWCGPCRMVAADVEKLSASAGGEFVVAKVNTEALPDIAARLRIQSIPTFAVFARGREVDRVSGALPMARLRDFVSRAADTGDR